MNDAGGVAYPEIDLSFVYLFGECWWWSPFSEAVELEGCGGGSTLVRWPPATKCLPIPACEFAVIAADTIDKSVGNMSE